jgi:hypothetical protein
LNDAACAGGNEKIATLDSASDVGQYAALQIGVDSVPVVAYLDVTNSKLKVAAYASLRRARARGDAGPRTASGGPTYLISTAPPASSSWD